jgi:hypothetical protein
MDRSILKLADPDGQTQKTVLLWVRSEVGCADRPQWSTSGWLVWLDDPFRTTARTTASAICIHDLHFSGTWCRATNSAVCLPGKLTSQARAGDGNAGFGHSWQGKIEKLMRLENTVCLLCANGRPALAAQLFLWLLVPS